ncbi:MAG: hypothetical protein SGBAC_012627 [Bacillariaceae sp.]
MQIGVVFYVIMLPGLICFALSYRNQIVTAEYREINMLIQNSRVEFDGQYPCSIGRTGSCGAYRATLNVIWGGDWACPGNQDVWCDRWITETECTILLDRSTTTETEFAIHAGQVEECVKEKYGLVEMGYIDKELHPELEENWPEITFLGTCSSRCATEPLDTDMFRFAERIKLTGLFLSCTGAVLFFVYYCLIFGQDMRAICIACSRQLKKLSSLRNRFIFRPSQSDRAVPTASNSTASQEVEVDQNSDVEESIHQEEGSSVEIEIDRTTPATPEGPVMVQASILYSDDEEDYDDEEDGSSSDEISSEEESLDSRYESLDDIDLSAEPCEPHIEEDGDDDEEEATVDTKCNKSAPVRTASGVEEVEINVTKNPVILLFLYEPDQLAEPTVHGSHLLFLHEGLVDLERQLQLESNKETKGNEEEDVFKYITVAHCSAIDAFQFIHRRYTIERILAHQETGHWQSFMRDKDVRKFCRSNSIPFKEFNQTGVTRCLKSRDDFSANFKAFISQPMHSTPNIPILCQGIIQVKDLPGFLPNLTLSLDHFSEIPEEQRQDRSDRQQKGGPTLARATLHSFLAERGSKFSQGISSPNTAWTTCSRLSPYLTWGHISHRHVIQALMERQEQLRKMKQHGRNVGTWLKGLQAFSSRVHWRSHFIQKLESEPTMEKRDLCPAYQGLRRQNGDWNDEYFHAWAQGKTGFPFVDACMRCLIQHGWLNFRMRAMVVSFATYNLWLDWKKLAPHLARVFLDYEPGIHYPQLQMQSGTAGINAMRVYNTTKQGKDHDTEGKFVRRYVAELRDVPTQYIHEPSKMPLSLQKQCNMVVGQDYPKPIVDEQVSAKIAKKKVADVKRQAETRSMANQVYLKHGSRSRGRAEMEGRKPKALSSFVERDDPTKQPTITAVFERSMLKQQDSSGRTKQASIGSKKQTSVADSITVCEDNNHHIRSESTTTGEEIATGNSIKKHFSPLNVSVQADAKRQKRNPPKVSSWTCRACTFLNDKPLALVCSICSTPRYIGSF